MNESWIASVERTNSLSLELNTERAPTGVTKKIGDSRRDGAGGEQMGKDTGSLILSTEIKSLWQESISFS